MNTACLFRCVVFSAVASSASLCAQEATSAKTILDLSVTALGGKDRLQAITSRVMTGEMEYMGGELHANGAPITTVWVAPDKLHQTIQAPSRRKNRTTVLQ